MVPLALRTKHSPLLSGPACFLIISHVDARMPQGEHQGVIRRHNPEQAVDDREGGCLGVVMQPVAFDDADEEEAEEDAQEDVPRVEGELVADVGAQIQFSLPRRQRSQRWRS